jgi:hypothetical protein
MQRGLLDVIAAGADEELLQAATPTTTSEHARAR